MTTTARLDPSGRWEVAEVAGPAQDLHDLALPDPLGPTVWFLRPTRPAMVLGSTQRNVEIDADAVGLGGFDVARRRSGGSLVVLVPDHVLWVDIVVPRADPRWDDDVGAACHWVGEVWGEALTDLGVETEVHRGAMVTNQYSPFVCFAGVGPGEVLISGRKVVGISQRRTRDAARFQCAALLEWDAAPYLRLMDTLAPEIPDSGAALWEMGRGAEVPAGDLEAALLGRLCTR